MKISHKKNRAVKANTNKRSTKKIMASDEMPVSQETADFLIESFKSYLNKLKSYYARNNNWKVAGYFVPEKNRTTGEIRNIWFCVDYTYIKPSGGDKNMILVEVNYDPYKSDNLTVYVTCPMLHMKDEFLFEDIDFTGTNFEGMDTIYISPLQEKIADKIYRGDSDAMPYLESSVQTNGRYVGAAKSIMAGAGSVITLKLNDIQFTEVPNGGFYQEYNGAHNFLEPENGWCKGTIDIKSIGTYYDGGDPGLGDIPVNIQVYEVRPDTYEEGEEMVGLSLKEVIDDIDDIEDTIHIGGGWVTITFDGKFDVTAYTYHSTVLLKVEIPDKELVDWLNRWAHGDTVEMYYEICINGDYQGNAIEDLDDAIETAKQYAADPQYADDEITVVIEHFRVNYYGDIEDYYDDDGDVVWSSNDELYE